MRQRSPVKYSKWYQPDEPDRESIHPMAVLGHIIGVLAVIFALIAKFG